MSNSIDDYVKRPIRYQNIDGLDELFLGFLWIALQLLDFFHLTAASGSVWRSNATFFLCVGVLAAVCLYGHKSLKSNITFPRTGYVKYRRSATGVWLRGSIAAAVAVGVALATVFVLQRLGPDSSEIGKMALTSGGWALFYIYITRMDAAWRWVVLLAMLVVPPLAAAFPIGRLLSGNLPFVLQGLIFFVSGLIGLTFYLHRNPLPEHGAE
jgi:hypothetical protein